MITMKLDKERISKIKSNIEVDLEFSQEARQECKSFEPFDDSDYYHVTRSLTDKIMPKGCHAEITDIFMDDHLL